MSELGRRSGAHQREKGTFTLTYYRDFWFCGRYVEHIYRLEVKHADLVENTVQRQMVWLHIKLSRRSLTPQKAAVLSLRMA